MKMMLHPETGDFMNVFEQLLTSDSRGSVSPETLEYIGQRASEEYLSKKDSLNGAIVKLAADHRELNNEHIHRIVEFANNATFQKLFDRNKDKNVHFDIADPGTVIRDLRDGGSPAHSGKVLHNKSDYMRRPITEEKDGSMGLDGSGVSDPESGMADLFRRENFSGQFGQGEAVQKVASAGLDPTWEGSANPVNDVYAEHVRLQRASEELAAAHETADMLHQQAHTDFYKAAKAEILDPDGAGFYGVVKAMSAVVDTPISTSDITKVAEELMRSGISMEQMGHRARSTGQVLNMEHPLVKAAAGLIKCAHDRSVAKEALLDVQRGLEKTAAFLKAQK